MEPFNLSGLQKNPVHQTPSATRALPSTEETLRASKQDLTIRSSLICTMHIYFACQDRISDTFSKFAASAEMKEKTQ
jgi:hypothetical protein